MQSKADYGIFTLNLLIDGKDKFWTGLLEIHDTHGLPFDLIYLKVKESAKQIPLDWTVDDFTEFMALYRRTAGQTS